VYEDLGSGCIADLSAYGVSEPLVADSLRAGVNLVSFSGDKLLGGPQAGVLAGDTNLVARVRRNPMFRAVRLDKVMYQALETTLQHYLFEEYDAIPALRMIRMSAAQIRDRAAKLVGSIPRADIVPGESVIGGGSTPEQAIPTYLIRVECSDSAATAEALRTGEPAVVARIENDRLLIDLRTVDPEEEAPLVAALQARSR
jgi:L-seryl-tRNA(Ser) seleniumtransferase